MISDFIKGRHNDTRSGIEVIGNSRAVVENVKSILEYETKSVRIDVGTRTVSVKGKSLTLNNYTDNVIVIDGVIKNISFE